jgi:diguanylate cyclase (GGDEF)-like protein
MSVTANFGVPPQRAPARSSGLGAQRPSTSQLSAIEATLRAIPMAAVALSLSYHLICANDDCSTLLDLSSDKIQGRPVKDFINECDIPNVLGTARSAFTASSNKDSLRPTSSLRRVISGNGQELTCWMHVGFANIAGYRCFVACIDLVNPVLSDAHRWRHRAEHDELTGLRRRGTLLAQVAQWINSDNVVLLAFLDIDNFKSINDTHGHAAGDHVLTTVARRLEQYAPPGCLVGRLSGDEFMLAQPVGRAGGQSGEAGAELLASAGARCVAEPIAWGDKLLMVSISVGVCISRPGEDPSTLLSRADDAMYRQKSHIAGPRR